MEYGRAAVDTTIRNKQKANFTCLQRFYERQHGISVGGIFRLRHANNSTLYHNKSLNEVSA